MAAPTPQQVQYYEQHAGDNRQPQMNASNICGLIIAYSAVSLRVLARHQSKAGLGKDDILIFLALLPLTGYAICGFLAVSFGEGRHIIFVTNVRGFIQEYVAAITCYSVAVALIKASILCFYCRLFPSNGLRIISWTTGTIVVAYNLALILVAALECRPLSSLWTGKPGKCINTYAPFLTLAIVNVATDVVILTLPLRFIWSLQMRTTRKIQLCGIFLLGGLACVFAIIRTVVLGTAAPGDQSYTQVYSGIWSFAEISVAVVAACLPTLGVLFTKTTFISISMSAKKVFRSRGSRSNDSSWSKGHAAGNGADGSLSRWRPDRWGKTSSSAIHITRKSDEERPEVPSMELTDYEGNDEQREPLPLKQIHLRREFGTSYTHV